MVIKSLKLVGTVAIKGSTCVLSLKKSLGDAAKSWNSLFLTLVSVLYLET